MRRWLDPQWYAYLRERLGPDRILLLALAALATLFLGGLFTMQALGSGGDGSGGSAAPVRTTVLRRVKVVEAGKTVARRVPVIKRVQGTPVTLRQTRTIETPGGTKIVTKPVVRYRIVHGKTVRLTSTVVHERTNTVVNERTNTVVQSQTQTQTQTVNDTVTSVRTRTQTLPSETVTVTGPTKTETVTTSATVTAAVTVTLPAVTVTVTTTKPR